MKALRKAVEDVCTVIVTPFHPDLSVNEPALRRHVERLIEGGLKVIVSCGNTGEFYALSHDENKQVAAAACEAAGDQATSVVGVGYSIPDAVDLARHAERSGAHAIMIHQPINPYVHPDGLASYYEAIIDATDLGVILYVKDPAVRPADLRKILLHPRLIGVKYAVNDLLKAGEFMAACPAENCDVAWICGTAEAWAPFFWAAGARGFTSGLANLAPQMSKALLAALRAGDQDSALDLWRKIKPFEDLRAKHHNGNNVGVVKAAMEMLGHKVGGVRPPSSSPRPEDYTALRAIVNHWDLNDTSPDLVRGPRMKARLESSLRGK